MEKKQLIVKKTWTVQMNYYSDGSTGMTRTNDGFAATELLGIVEFVKMEIHDQLRGDLKPTYVKREVVNP